MQLAISVLGEVFVFLWGGRYETMGYIHLIIHVHLFIQTRKNASSKEFQDELLFREVFCQKTLVFWRVNIRSNDVVMVGGANKFSISSCFSMKERSTSLLSK